MTRRVVIHPPAAAPEGTIGGDVIDELKRYEERVLAGEGDALRARWESGKRLLPMRVGKQLPKALTATLTAQLGLASRELQRRMRFAEKFPTEAKVRRAVTDFPTWHQMTNEGIVTKRKKRTPTPSNPKVVGEARLLLARMRKEAEKVHGYGWDDATKRLFDDLKAELMRIQDEINMPVPAEPEAEAATS